MRFTRGASILSLGLCMALLALAGCSAATGGQTPTPDYPRLETAVAQQLSATLTAKAPPTATRTPSPSPAATEPAPGPTSTPVQTLAPPEAEGDLIAYVRLSQDGSTNIVMADEGLNLDQSLTRFVEINNMCSVSWSPDGEWLVFVSSHDFVHSRDNERNVFRIRADGTGLSMVTGDYLDPATAPGPYVAVKGQVQGCEGPALVSAEGVAAPVTADDSGNFELVGVPVSARWARAVCAAGSQVLQGDVSLDLGEPATEPITIEVTPEGHGWLQASLSRDGDTVAGTQYDWHLDAEGNQEMEQTGVLYDLEAGTATPVETPEGATVGNLVWSPVDDLLLGSVTDGDGASLWLWDAEGKSLGSVLTLENEDDVIYTIEDPVWSPDGTLIAFARRDWAWWEDDQFKSDLYVISASGEDLRTLVPSEWGTAVSHPAWTSDGQRLYYQVSPASVDQACTSHQMSIWSVAIGSPDGETPEPAPWQDDGLSGFPCVRPVTPSSDAAMP